MDRAARAFGLHPRATFRGRWGERFWLALTSYSLKRRVLHPPGATFDEKCGFSDWTIHDLRRTARSLLSRAGVDADIAERCLGHAIGGIRGIYDRHAYYDEKKHAFEVLAAQIDRIVNPSPNVIPLRNIETAAG